MLPNLFGGDGNSRKHHINTLKVFNPNVSEIVEDIEYQVTFDSGGKALHLNIKLGKDFPKEKPSLKIIPAIIHHWVNADGEITSAPGLLNFTVHSDLGRVVQAIIREFQRTPPPLVSNSITNATSPSISILNQVPSANCNSFSPPTNMPALNTQSIVFPDLNKLTLDELEFLAENDDRQQEFLDDLPYIKEQNRILDEQIVQTEELADTNMQKQEQLLDLRKQIDYRIDEVAKLAFENERLHVIYQSHSDKYSPRNIQDLIRIAGSEADVNCEKIADSFLNGEIDVDKFINQYTKERKLCHMRKTKEEKLAHQLDSLERAGF